MLDKIQKLLSGLDGNAELPQTRDTVSDCLLMVGFQILSHYVTADSPLTTELDFLMNSLSNTKDPMVKDIGTANLFALRQVISQVKKIRKQVKEGMVQHA